ncbi:MAG: lytic transglycosylase [Proteobacteria bacterium]|nr:MAG: lytic transglycosylase [Pseudomonadota bacterium]
MQTQSLPQLLLPLRTAELEPLPETIAMNASDHIYSDAAGTNSVLADTLFPATSTGAETPPVEAPSTNLQLHKELIPFHGFIVQAAGRYRVDPHLIRAIIFAESSYNPNAESKKGARGLMQLMPSTAEALGIQNVLDPEENIDGGVRYFRSLLDRFDNDVQLALAAYNAGSRHVRNYEGVPPFKSTRLYIKKVLEFRNRFKSETTSQTGGITA